MHILVLGLLTNLIFSHFSHSWRSTWFSAFGLCLYLLLAGAQPSHTHTVHGWSEFLWLDAGHPSTQLILDSFTLCTHNLSGQLLCTPWVWKFTLGPARHRLAFQKGHSLLWLVLLQIVQSPVNPGQHNFDLNLFLKRNFISSVHQVGLGFSVTCW